MECLLNGQTEKMTQHSQHIQAQHIQVGKHPIPLTISEMTAMLKVMQHNNQDDSSSNVRLYKHPVVGASAFVQEPVEGRILLVLRANEPGKGLWALPGGVVEYGETVEDAVVREVLEETGIKIRVEGLAGRAAYDIIDTSVESVEALLPHIPRNRRFRRTSGRYHYLVICFRGVPHNSKINIGPDVDDALWFYPDKIDESRLTDTTSAVLIELGILN